MPRLDGDALLPLTRAWKTHILVLVISGIRSPRSKRRILTEWLQVSLQNLLQILTVASNSFS
jgi:hypothetical protein